MATKAQHMQDGKGAYFGFKAGANFSNVIKSGDSDFKSHFKPGFAAGIFVDIPIAETFSFAPELVYSQKGYQSSGSFLSNDYDYKVTTNFVDVPLLAKFWLSEGFNFSIGPQVSFLTSTTESFKSGSEEFRNTIEEKNKNLKKSLFGGVVGFGYELGNSLGLHARYALDFQKNNADGTSEVPEYKNQVIQLGLTYQF
ncbi:MAG: porin family protein [Sphingobacteriaceae bacterium]